MKKALTLLFAALIIWAHADAKGDNLRRRYINLGYTTQILTTQGNPMLSNIRNDVNVTFTIGRTYSLHKEPLARIIQLGIDATWFDMNYANYQVEKVYEEDFSGKCPEPRYHQIEMGGGAGWSLTND